MGSPKEPEGTVETPELLATEFEAEICDEALVVIIEDGELLPAGMLRIGPKELNGTCDMELTIASVDCELLGGARRLLITLKI